MDKEEVCVLISRGEGLAVEFKRSFSPRLDEDIVAFSNSRGGCILLGVDDDKHIRSFALTNDIRGKILSIARNCKPAIEVSIEQVGKIVAISVPEGLEKPYSCSSGYFRRLDGSTQKMNSEEIRLSYFQNEPVPFEERTAHKAGLSDISETKLKAFLKEAGIESDAGDAESLLTSFKMFQNGYVNNAGVMFFAKEPRMFISQCQSSMIAFKGVEPIHIFDRMDVKDDLLGQFSQAMFFLKKHLNLSSTIKGIKRIDEYEIPTEALREAVANAIVHRDYSVHGTDLTVRIFDDRVEITNPASFGSGVKPSDLEGVSIRRNEIIADMFYRLDVVERAGTGIRKMRRMMRDAGLLEPEIAPGAFYRIIFRRPVRKDLVKDLVKSDVKDILRDLEKINKNQQRIMIEIAANPKITQSELSKKIGISEKNIRNNITKLKTANLISRVGPDKGGHWEIVGNKNEKQK